jgi:glycosyltransferase involved in cell wall biosynthesis
MEMYGRLESRLREKDVFVLWTGAMVHPEFVAKLSTYNVYVCSDDPDSSDILSRPAAPAFDYCFTRNVACEDLYRSWGVRHVKWLCPPVVADFTWPELTEEMILRGPRDLDTIMFCERVYGISDRPKRVERLIREFPQTYVRGKGWPGGFASHEDIVSAYKRARIGWNLHNSVGPTNSRVTALPGFGVMQICDNKSHLGRIFKLDEEVVGFDTIEECIDKTRYYLAHEEERRQIALKGWRRAVNDYSEPRQWERILSSVASDALRKLRIQEPPRPSAPSASGNGAVKLHIGCGRDHWKGYVNVDKDPAALADLVADHRDLHRFVEKGTVEEAVMIHSLNYLTLWEARDFFRNLFGLMAPGGKVAIETPDGERLIEKMRQGIGKDLDTYLEGLRAFHGFGLDDLADKRVYVPNAFSWTSWHLGMELRNAGFEDVRVLAPETHASWRDMRVEVRKPGSASAGRRDWTPASQGNVKVTQKKGTFFCLYDSMMGHATLQTRGLMFKEEFLRNGWDFRYLDFRKANREEILREASQSDVTYMLKIIDYSMYQALKEKTRTKVVFDLTDALWTPVHQRAGWGDLDKILRISDALFSENDWVCAYGRKFTDQVYSIPVCTQPEKFDAVKASMPPRDRDKLVVGWVGSTGTVQSLELVREALEELSRKYRNLEFRIVGCTDPLVLPQFRNLDFSVLPEYNEETMMREILDMDVGIFPAPFGIEDFAIRGGQKGYLYMTAGVPAVFHNAGDPSLVIKDGVTGMLVDKPEDWYAKLDRLLGDPGLRARMGRAGMEMIRERHAMPKVFAVLESAIKSVMARG